MATYSTFLRGSTSGHSANAYVRNVYVAEAVIDFSKQNAAASDVFQALQIPAETVVLAANAEVITAGTSSGSPTVDLGDGADPNQWVSGGDPTATGYLTRVPITVNTTSGLETVAPLKYYSTADTLDITVNTADLTAGVIRVFAVMADVSGVNEAALV